LTEQARLATVAVAQAAVNTDNGGDVAIANGKKICFTPETVLQPGGHFGHKQV